MKITKEELIAQGWKEENLFGKDLIVFYNKTINGFHYSLRYSPKLGNYYDWFLHIDNPTCESVGQLEVDTFEQINLIAQIYNNEKN